MKTRFISQIMVMSMVAASLAFVACGDGGGGKDGSKDGSGENGPTVVGESVAVTAGTTTFNMIYANDQTSITFPFSLNASTPVDDQKAILTKKFLISETEVTNALVKEVLQWAKNNNRIIETPGHNEVSVATVKYGGKELIDLDAATGMKISYDTALDTFSVATGFENYPVVNVSWYGAIMFCNWLTEMRDGNANNVVYAGIDTTWTHTETTEDAAKTGYRLPSSEEWEFAARYIGTTVPTGGSLPTEYVAQNVNGGTADLIAGYFWTPADYASGATKDYNNSAETNAVCWWGSAALKEAAGKAANQLGLFDMSGNASEWCFTLNTSNSYRVYRGGSFDNPVIYVQIGGWDSFDPTYLDYSLGFRLARTR